MTARALFGSRRPYRAYQIARGRRALASAVVLAAVAALGGFAIAPRSDAALPSYFAYTTPVVPDTSYAIPGGALFVSNSGNDASPGTASAPKRTLTNALAHVASGGTIVMRGGTYREAPGTVTKRVTIQAYPHEQVWLKGSAVVTGWSQSGSVWVHTGWSTPGVCDTCYPGGVLDPAYPLAGLADQAFWGGVPQRQVSSLAAVRAGTFFVDHTNHRLVVGSNPSQHPIEATVFPKALQFSTAAASGSVVRGIGFAEYAAHYNFDVPAMVVAATANISFVKDTFAFSASRGLSVLSSNGVVTDSLFIDNGANGFHANAANGLDFERNYVGYNNFERFSITPSGSASIAGVKITSTANQVIRSNVVLDNWSNGIWLDVTCFNSIVADNIVVRNAGHGVAVELSGTTIVAGNTIGSNGRIGLKISGANNVQAWSNTVANNGWSAVGVYEDPRSNPHPANGVTWNTAQVVLADNVFEAPSGSTGAVLDSFDGNNPHRTTTQGMIASDARNLWARPVAGAPRFVASWQISLSSKATYGALGNLQAAVHREAGSIAADNTPSTTLFVNPAGDDFRLGSHSPARVQGLTLPSNVAAAMGVNPNVPVLGSPIMPMG